MRSRRTDAPSEGAHHTGLKSLCNVRMRHLDDQVALVLTLGIFQPARDYEALLATSGADPQAGLPAGVQESATKWIKVPAYNHHHR